MSRRALSLAEILIVVSIILILIAFLVPMIKNSKGAAMKAVCQSNLKQAWLTLQMYRDAVQGIDSPGPTWAMGFPPYFAPGPLSGVLGSKGSLASELKCKSPIGYPDGTREPSYVSMWPTVDRDPSISEGDLDAFQKEWKDYVEKEGGKSIVIVDPNHQKHWPATRFSFQDGLGVSLSGSIRKRTHRGSCLETSWWTGD